MAPCKIRGFHETYPKFYLYKIRGVHETYLKFYHHKIRGFMKPTSNFTTIKSRGFMTICLLYLGLSEMVEIDNVGL